MEVNGKRLCLRAAILAFIEIKEGLDQGYTVEEPEDILSSYSHTIRRYKGNVTDEEYKFIKDIAYLLDELFDHKLPTSKSIEMATKALTQVICLQEKKKPRMVATGEFSQDGICTDINKMDYKSLIKAAENDDYLNEIEAEILNKKIYRIEKNRENYLCVYDLIKGGALKDKPDENGKFKTLFSSMQKFIEWCFNNGYDDIQADFIVEYIDHSTSLATIKKYIQREREINKEAQNQKNPRKSV
jgi:hypothetical protein